MASLSFRVSPDDFEIIKTNADSCGMSVFSFCRMAACVVAGHMLAVRDYSRFVNLSSPRVARRPLPITISPAMKNVIQKVAADAGIPPSVFVRYSALSFTDFNHVV